jgi:hypothetical protein
MRLSEEKRGFEPAQGSFALGASPIAFFPNAQKNTRNVSFGCHYNKNVACVTFLRIVPGGKPGTFYEVYHMINEVCLSLSCFGTYVDIMPATPINTDQAKVEAAAVANLVEADSLNERMTNR